MFAFDETHRAVEAALRDYCTREIEPHALAMERGDVSPYDVMRRLSSAFSLRDMVQRPRASASTSSRRDGAEQTGDDAAASGGGADALGDPALAAIFAKEISRVSPGLCLCIAANMGCGATIAARGNAELVERFALPVLSFEKVGCWGLTEPGSGSDAFSLRTRATIEGDTVILNGSKTFISNAPAAEVFLVYARVGDQSGHTDKQRVFPVVVERGTRGLSTGPAMQKLGMHASPTGEIFLDDCRVPRSHLLGDPSRPARDAAEATLATERAAIVAMCVGVIERCLDESLRFATGRVQFGRPIAGFQLIQEKLARMYVALENSRNVMFKLIWQQRHGTATERETSAAKLYASESAASVALEAVQLMGGAGYMQDSVVERLFRDIKLWTIGGGTSEIQLLTIAKDLLKEHGVHIDFAGGYRKA